MDQAELNHRHQSLDIPLQIWLQFDIYDNQLSENLSLESSMIEELLIEFECSLYYKVRKLKLKNTQLTSCNHGNNFNSNYS